jgi:Ca2+-binding RTX toxin-like protein
MATINFTNNADYVDQYNYGSGVHIYNLLKGEDTFSGSYVRATVYGGDGADYIYGGSANDTLYGNLGSDYISGGEGTDTVYGGDGNDILDMADDGFDVIYAGNGNDRIYADGDRIDAGAGSDLVGLTFYGGQRADVNLGPLGNDKLTLDIHEHDWNGYNSSRVDVVGFTASDKLEFSSAHNDYEWLDHGQTLDRLDVNNDGWLGAKDVEAFDYDGVTVHVGQNFLELDVFDTSVVLHGMTKASFDFLA